MLEAQALGDAGHARRGLAAEWCPAVVGSPMPASTPCSRPHFAAKAEVGTLLAFSMKQMRVFAQASLGRLVSGNDTAAAECLQQA